jgi:hypothetical protein
MLIKYFQSNKNDCKKAVDIVKDLGKENNHAIRSVLYKEDRNRGRYIRLPGTPARFKLNEKWSSNGFSSD